MSSKVVPLYTPSRGKIRPVVVWYSHELMPPKADVWLLQAIAQSEHERLIQACWMHRPSLKRASATLASIITPKWPGYEGRSLLAQALDLAGSQVSRLTSDVTQSKLVTAYLSGLLSIHLQVAEISVVGVTGNDQSFHWEPFSSALHTWAREHQIVRIEAYGKTNPADTTELAGIKAHMLASITSLGDAGIMQRYFEKGFEQS